MNKKIKLEIKAIPVAPYFQVKELLHEHIISHMKHGEKLPSERTLAESAGIARATIAKAINQLVSEGILVRIHGKGTYVSGNNKREITNYLKYFNDSIKLKRKFKICVIYSQIENSINDKFLQACLLLEEIDKNMRLLFDEHPYAFNLHGRKEPLNECLEIVRKIKPDGIVFVPPCNDEDISIQLLKKLQELSITVVVANGEIKGANTDSIVCVHKGGLKLLVDYLISEGHRDMAFVTRPSSPAWVADRQKGYQESCIKNGLHNSAENIFSSPLEGELLSPESYVDLGRKVGTKIFKDLKYSAIIGLNDSIAVGLYQAAQKAGLNIPEDCSLVGFDDYFPFREYNLTTMSYPIRDIAENALGILLLRLHDNRTRKILPTTGVIPELVKRGTVKKIIKKRKAKMVS